MSAPAVARNYAEVLYDLASATDAHLEFGDLIDAVASAITTSPEIQAVLVSPRVPKAQKSELFGKALGDLPVPFVRFLQAVVQRGRQGLLREIAAQYTGLVDIKHNRIRAGVTLARAASPELERSITEALTKALGKEVVATFATDPAILGGTVVRVGERVYDGSVRRRMTRLRRQLLSR